MRTGASSETELVVPSNHPLLMQTLQTQTSQRQRQRQQQLAAPSGYRRLFAGRTEAMAMHNMGPPASGLALEREAPHHDPTGSVKSFWRARARRCSACIR
jgi:hypothetical protein